MKVDAALMRDGTPDDAASVAKVRIDTWRQAYAGIVPADHLARLSYEEGAKKLRERFETYAELNRFLLVGEDPSGEVVAFANSGPERDGDPIYKGEVYAIYVLPDCQQKGFGRQLMARSAERLRLAGIDTLLVWVLAANPHRGFYDRLGGEPVRERDVEIGGARLPEIGYGWPSLSALSA